MLYRTILMALACATMAAGTARANSPAGIVMAITGTSEPPLVTMDEILANVPLRLGAGTKLTFLDYANCKLVSVAGGTVTLRDSDYEVTGRIESKTDGPCPRVYAVNTGHDTSGLIFRGSPSPRWPTNAAIVFVGPHAADVMGAAVFAQDRPDQALMALEISDRRTRLPQKDPLLSPNTRYALRLTMRDRADPLEVPFVGAAPIGSPTLVILRID
jgi:hypothetical protein